MIATKSETITLFRDLTHNSLEKRLFYSEFTACQGWQLLIRQLEGVTMALT